MKNPPGPIRFGVICGNNQLYAWEDMVIRKLISETDIELKLVVFGANPNCPNHQVSSFEDSSDSQGILWSLYYRQRVKKKSRALQMLETKAIFEDSLIIQCDFIAGKDGYTELEDVDVAEIENSRLDFILDFSYKALRGKVINVAKYGIWTYRFGDIEKFTGNPPCFWEIYNENLITSAHLTRLSNESGTVTLLEEGYLKTHVLYSKNIDKIHFECTAWPLKVCEDIRNNRIKNLKTHSKIKLGRVVLLPSNLQLLTFFLIQIKLLIKRVCKSLFYTDYWNIGLSYSPIHEFLSSEKIPVVQWFPNLPKARFMADPFGIYFKDDLYVLYEDLLFDQGVGKTASFLFKNGSFTENKIVIDEKFHMSYPFLLEQEGQIYCIPETYQANQVRLYKAVKFPDKWKMEKVLIENYSGIDNTLFEHEGVWFLFSTNKNSGPHHNLNLHYSDSIFGPWHPHPKNPVKTDIRSVRPAGTIFEHNGEIFRPSMDYSEKIEGRIFINKIVTLTRDDFKEEVNNVVDPFKNTYFSDKVHTLSKIGSYTLVDGAKELFIFSNFYALKYKVKRILARLKKK